MLGLGRGGWHPHQVEKEESAVRGGGGTCVAEDPGGDVGPRAHEVLHIQTGFQAGFASALVPNNLIDARAVWEASPKEVHEFGQVSLVEVLLKELQRRRGRRAT